jgi:ubiquinone/menaquinone biosynthesis C-methylase UbiE
MDRAHPVLQEYDRLAPEYDRRWKHYIDSTMELVLSGLSLSGDERVLDVPCGTGELERHLLTRWPDLRIVGADLSPQMLSQARAKENVGSRVEWVEADVCQLPLPNHSFDYAICANSFHYFRSPLDSLQEMRRVLQPDGTLVLVDWCDDFLVCKLCSLWLRWTDPAFYRTYSSNECSALVEQVGFRVTDTQVARVGWTWGLMRLTASR